MTEQEMFENNIKEQYKILDDREAELDARLEEIKRREANLRNPDDILVLLRAMVGTIYRACEEIQVLRYNYNMRGEKISSLEHELGQSRGDGNGKSLHR